MKLTKGWLCLSLTADQGELLSYYMQKMLDSNGVANPEWVQYVRDAAKSWSDTKRKQDKQRREYELHKQA
jgi:hypothetical protein